MTIANRTEKFCARCETTKPREKFGRNKGHVDGMSTYCLVCKSQDELKRRRANPEAYRRYRRVADRKHKYGLTAQAYTALLVQHEFRCGICNTQPLKSLHIDHCHESGKVRGLLCDLCNRGIGYFRDNPATLQAAAAYLRERA